MQSVSQILSQSLPRNSSKPFNTSSTTDTTTDKPLSYEDWYNQPGNTIRKWDEEHGIKLMRDTENGNLRFLADYDTLFKDNLTAQTYPEYFSNRHFEMFKTGFYAYGDNRNLAEAALKKTMRYLKGMDTIINSYSGTGLYYYSKQRGSGKTLLSTILGNELSNSGYRVRWYTMINLIQEIKSCFDRDSETSSSEIINQAKNAQILILDDIGVEKQSAWLNETVYDILNHRMTRCKPTIFTSNLEPHELQYDERIIDRINRMTEIIHMPEQNVRQILSRQNRISEFLEG